VPTPPLSPDILDALRQYDSPTISNAVEHFRVRDPASGFASLELVCQFPDRQPPLLGYAVTCTADSSTPGDTRPSQLQRVWDALEASPQPAILAIQYAGPDRLRACVAGDMIATGLQQYGGRGIVTDAAVRDRTGIRQKTQDFHVFCPGSVVSHGYPIFIDFNIPVTICGLTIRPGDLLHGDESGLLTVPLEIAGQLAERAQAVRDRENEYFSYLKSPDFNVAGLRQRMKGH
jgi:regulator of RNase E activity RraA